MFAPAIEAAIAGALAECRRPAVIDAFRVLANLPEAMATAFRSKAPLRDVAGGKNYFGGYVLDELKNLIDLANANPDDVGLTEATAAIAKGQSK